MNCNECIQVNPIPTCTEQWVIDGVDPAYDGSELLYRITNIATGNELTGTTETVSGGDVAILVEDILPELMNHTYTVHLFDADWSPIEITVGEISGCCIEFRTFPYIQESVTFSNAVCDV